MTSRMRPRMKLLRQRRMTHMRRIMTLMILMHENPHLHTEGDLDADFLDDEPDTYQHPATQPKRRRKLMVAGVLVAAVATGGAGAFVYKSYEDGSIGNGDAPTVLADDGPVKSKPSDPGGKEFPDSNKQIYDRLNGKPAEPVEEAQAGSDRETGSTAIPGSSPPARKLRLTRWTSGSPRRCANRARPLAARKMLRHPTRTPRARSAP